jgi:hypothetical protein
MAVGTFHSLRETTIKNHVFLKVPQSIYKALIFYNCLGTRAKVKRKFTTVLFVTDLPREMSFSREGCTNPNLSNHCRSLQCHFTARGLFPSPEDLKQFLFEHNEMPSKCVSAFEGGQ